MKFIFKFIIFCFIVFQGPNINAYEEPSWVKNKSNSGTIKIQGVVEQYCVIDIINFEPLLDLQKGEKGTEIASITESCNIPSGYNISFVSLNGGLKSNGENETLIPYSLNYSGAKIRDLSTNTSLERSKEAFKLTHILTIDVSPKDQNPSGLYTDQIYVQITAK